LLKLISCLVDPLKVFWSSTIVHLLLDATKFHTSNHAMYIISFVVLNYFILDRVLPQHHMLKRCLMQLSSTWIESWRTLKKSELATLVKWIHKYQSVPCTCTCTFLCRHYLPMTWTSLHIKVSIYSAVLALCSAYEWSGHHYILSSVFTSLCLPYVMLMSEVTHSLELILVSLAWRDWEYFYSPLDRKLPPAFAGTHLYTWVERGIMRVKCLAQDHNTMSLARTQTWTAQSGDECANHEVLCTGCGVGDISIYPNQVMVNYMGTCVIYFCC